MAAAGGEAFEKECIEGIRAEGRIKMAQRYFGRHYVADEMPEGNDEYLEIF